MRRTCRDQANHRAARRNRVVLAIEKPAAVRQMRHHGRMEQRLHWLGDREAVRAVCQEERGGRAVSGYEELMRAVGVKMSHSPWCAIEHVAPHCPDCGCPLRASADGPWFCTGKCNFACRMSDAKFTSVPCDCAALWAAP